MSVFIEMAGSPRMPPGRNEPIAIIGMGCRFPGEASTPSKLWDLLHNPRDVSRDIPDSQFNLDRFYHPTGSHHGTTNVRQAYLLSEDVREFDAKFFSISPGEAEAIDPQQRLLLEVAKALNPDLEPFTSHLRVPTANQPWPELADGTPRRASVNSFGFGGTNAHCILETYYPPTPSDPVPEIETATSGTCCIPAVFSAASDNSLVTLLRDLLCSEDLQYPLHRSTSFAKRLSTIEAASEKDATLPSTTAFPGTALIAWRFHRPGRSVARHGVPAYIVDPAGPEDPDVLTDSTSPVGKASLSQPLCTAVQVILVDLVRAAGVKFQAVGGHSSGEIAAAYAAGFITAWDAIRIAYYWGFYANMATGSFFEDASELCQVDDFDGRICVAAHNSPTSVTLSVKRPGLDAPQWFSSVRNGQLINSPENLDGQYWVDNMVQPVLFCPAVETCLTTADKAINCTVEVGPHPALQGPAKDCILAAVDREIPYTGTLNRGKNSAVAFSDTLGFLWSRFGTAAVTLGAFQQTNYPDTPTTIIRGLPTYPWTHDRGYFAESRLIKTFHKHPVPFHDLLGIQTADGATEEWRWRNILKMNELKWLSGHSLQGQVVFPEAGYICLAMEAALQLAQGRPVKSIDLFDLEIRKAIAIHDSTGTELLTSMTKVSTSIPNAANLALNRCGRTYPTRKTDRSRRVQILRDDFGFGYEGPFRALTNVSRKAGFATGTIRCKRFDGSETSLLFHPGMLDSALQGLNAAQSAPGDGRLWTIVAPTFCRRISIIPRLCGSNITDNVEIDCNITDPRDTHVTGDVEVFSEGFKEKPIEVEGLTFSPFAGATVENDRYLFQEPFLCLDKPNADVIFGDRQATPKESRKALDAERAAFYYLKTFHLSNAERLFHIVNDGKHPFASQSWVSDTREDIFRRMDSYPPTDADFNPTKAIGEHLLLPSVLNGDTSILQYMTKDNYLEQYYVNTIGFQLLNFLIAGMMEQLCLKSPRMNFLEVGAGTGGATKAILEKISYDVVVASNVLHATDSLRTALEHTRKLLRPGGYLWIVENDGRYGGPSITLEERDKVLRETGFSSIETNSPMRDPVGVPGSIIVSRAQNDLVSQLSRPLSSKSSTANDKTHLLVLGGSSPSVSPFRDKLCLNLRPQFADVIKLDQFEDLPPLPESYHVLSLTECDANLFEDVEESVFSNLKTVLGSALSVLWLLRDRRSSNPHAGITLGLFRTLFYEIPGTLLQTLDIDAVDMNDCSVIAKSMFQLRLQSDMARRGETNEIRWEFEPELVLKDGQLYVPRVRPHDGQNNRYNSPKRSITRNVDVHTTPLALDLVDDSYIIREQHAIERDSPELIKVIVSCSFLSSIKTPVRYVFVCLGEDVKTGEKTICFTSRNESIVKAPKSWTISLDEVEVDGQFMSFVTADLTVQWVLQMLPPTGTVLAYEPDPVAASLLSQQLNRLSRKAFFVTSSPKMSGRNWVYLHHNSTKRAITALLPANITLYIDASGADESHSQSLGSKIATSLSSVCDKVKMSSLAASEASVLPHDAPKAITDLLRRVASFASSLLSAQATPEGAPLDILPLKRTAANFAVPNPRSLVYWQEDQYVLVSVEPVTQRGDLFRPDRTYWLVGLAGDTGQSLADFMIAHNARNIVLSSRKPTVYEDWVQWHKSRGATVRYFEGDITSFKSMKQIHDAIKESMPPIGGVANGAMVLRDSSFMRMSFEDFQVILGPKIQGTINLDRLFSDPNQPLDWFIGFSSVAATVGNPGQSAYTAGNCFIKGLVGRRRKQGLAGSVSDITRLVGLGFIERESHGRLAKEHQERLTTRSGTIAMSENDLHQLFAEAILSGRPDLGLNPEIITGLAPITVEQSKDAYWKTNTRLSLLTREVGQGDTQGGKRGNAVPLRQLLEAAKTMQDAAKVLSGAFKGMLQELKFLSDSDSLYDTTPLVDMGVDSLVAVEILGGASIAELVEVVVQKLPQELLSRLDPEGQRKGSNGDVPVTVADKDSVESSESKTSGIDSDREIGSSGVNGINGINGTHDTDMDGTTNVNGTNGTVVIEEKLEHKTTNGAGPIIISAQEVA
ncbi:hypothetical protein IFM51744_07886 [Aspergillus udagawae]|nr:hypothetical protein IFM51744_07886 [Aspergillus udagawae]